MLFHYKKNKNKNIKNTLNNNDRLLAVSFTYVHIYVCLNCKYSCTLSVPLSLNLK